MNPEQHTYQAAGVSLDAAARVKERIKEIAAPTQGPQVLGGAGGPSAALRTGFGSLYQLSGYREPVLVSSTDGVGTKLKLAVWMGRYDTVGMDLVVACANDIVVTGAKPLFFLDYIAVGKLRPEVIEALVQGMARACQELDCALIGGETAQMPGVYSDDDFDLAGFVVGVVERSEMMDISQVRQGDVLIGVPSSGLHTNGYSLVRHALGLDRDQSPLFQHYPELGGTLGDALLTPHRSYYSVTRQALGLIKGAAHITGGGLRKNVPRVLPEGLGAELDTNAWPVPPIFTLLQEMGGISREEMYNVFNMGLGLVMVCHPSRVREVTARVPEAMVVGEVIHADGEQRVILSADS